MNAHLGSTTFLPEIDREEADFVRHMDLEAGDDTMSFAEHVDSAAEVEM
jgi:hypothetical protein